MKKLYGWKNFHGRDMFKFKSLLRFLAVWLGIVAILSISSAAAFAAETADFIEFVSEGKHFSVQIPSGWEKDESFFLKAYEECGVRLRAPGLKELGYVLIDIIYYGEEYRTPERFIFDKLNPARYPHGEARSPVQDITISGMKAKTFEIRSSRYPIAGIGDAKVEPWAICCLPAKKVFVRTYNTPAGTAQNTDHYLRRCFILLNP
jgi:hypothetical protein